MREQAITNLDKAWKDFLFELAYGVGIIWMINRTKFLKLKPWVEERLANKNTTG